ncbi:transmembrane channel-like protein 7 [Brienomyrus brachyistius]|uniref:transmembrane channel-like protein 7 n=1 Tax=Brienomyrus brachyistius TaxID=42636 RepID=UPI0020B2BC38|nr:transmembrane channel-like protein 7 [Brienomyrus brachyistius]XP_048871485.1 transmembrane channel-like protein 7 [Brienomyrus brachyistius]XP_048871486.1 transmembrane channel-like protein 7 [Brienomyrus brachyistius]
MASPEPSSTFLRLVSEETDTSELTVVFCDDVQQALCDQPPGGHSKHQQHRPGGSLQGQGADDNLWGLNRDKDPNVPLRNLPLTMQEKRDTRDRRHLQRRSIGCWESWRRSQSIMRRRCLEQMWQFLSELQPWRRTLHTIEGKFGVGVKVYFAFLRYLVYLNLLSCFLTGGLIQAPVIIFNRDRLHYSGSLQNISILHFLLGTGILEKSPVFYRFYKPVLWRQCLNTPLLFLLGVSSVLIFSLVVLVRRTVNGYKHKWMLGVRYSFNMSFKVFGSWDFCIQDSASAALKQRVIRDELKMDLEEEQYHLRVSQRTCRQKLWLCFIRLLLNFMVVVLLGGSFYLIYLATEFSQPGKLTENEFLRPLQQYLPPITITLVNFVLPHLFRIISKFEDYSLTVQVNITLVRSIILKLACLGIFLFSLYATLKDNSRENSSVCWENQFGQEMYKLLIFDFLACFTVTFFVMFPRTLLREHFPNNNLLKTMGLQKFVIPFHVLDLIYSQTVTWVGVFYCPLLPFISLIKLFLVFYIKKFAVRRCCDPAHRVFRASNSSVLFHFILLLGLLMAIAVLGLTLNKLPPSPQCGPFKGRSTVFNITAECVDSLPKVPRDLIHFMSSEAFALSLILAEIILLTSSMSQRSANNKCIERLKNMLVICSSDKWFLVRHQSAWPYSQSLESSDFAGSRQLSPTPLQEDLS